MFKRNISLNINLSDKIIDTLVICLDKMNYDIIDHIPFVDRLEKNESYEMNVYNKGCFSSNNGYMVVSKIDNDIFIEINDRKKRINTEELKYLRKFELELIHMNYGGCTTIEHYTLEYKNEVLEIKDGSCNWFGYGRLYNKLFNQNS